ncbi:MAG: deoxyribonuclease V [Candidatus Poribacteria bacterium]|nr:deoxyribonuclease V [Candidatus Poribacteria bacterium]
MKYHALHSWDVSSEEARQIQNRLRTQVVTTDRFGTINTVAGVDIGLKKDIARASVVVLSFPELQVVDSVVTESPVRFPYIPGLLSFREIPPLLTAFSQLQTEPDLVIVDGQGIAHPRRFGLASHLGLVLDKPTIGCAKSRLWGRYEEPDSEQGAYTYLTDKDEVIGAAVRTRTNVRVVYVSIGHRISLDSARTWTLACCQGYRLPETTRHAHNAASGKIPKIRK